MFGRRVFASAGVPRHMWSSLHIQNRRQAQRVLPSLAPLASLGKSGAMLKPSLLPTTLAQTGVLAEVLPSEEGLLSHCISGMPFFMAVLSHTHNFISPCLARKFFALPSVRGAPDDGSVAARKALQVLDGEEGGGGC
ncbi:uncharacterized protein Tco025E_01019 [Trypanosoma conorhini]|uniref:Uncharacterized protein n=1 Tax=Trypanosoma conorhini TaxID=83891 RepID=A0A3R7NTH2_9TRYP|nr:uncharacterized protein Tco025E_01019 [Trypanosoma conorhini]RNF26784.1 hypothetical protein Tco025E_01019 [Trypanosoma conorhini]